jgi:hypothetical protein
VFELAAVPMGAVAVAAIVGAEHAPAGLFLSCPAHLHAAFGRAMKRHSFVRGLLAATTLATGLLLFGSTAASAQSTDIKSHTTTVLPPVFDKPRITCGDEGAGLESNLRNPNATLQEYMVGVTAGDVQENYVVQVAPHGAELVGFGDLPNGTYLLQAQNPAGDLVATARGRVQCDVTPPTGTPTATPTGTPTTTPTASPSETPTTVPTDTPSATTAVPSTPVNVPTAVDAGLPGPVTQDDSIHGGTIVGAGLLAVGIMIGLVSFLVRRRRGLHQH